MRKSFRPFIWSKLRPGVKNLWRRIRPLEKHEFLLTVWFESGLYNEIDVEEMNRQIAKALLMMQPVGVGSRLVTQLLDKTSECKTDVA